MRMELEACQNETEWLFKGHDCMVNNLPEERCPPMPLLIPPDYVQNLGRRSKMAIKGVLPPPFKVILNTYDPLSPQPPQPSPQCAVPLRRPPVQQSPSQQQCSGTRVVTVKEMTVERSAKNVCMEGHNEGGMDPEPGQLEQSLAGASQLESSSAGTDQLESPSAGTHVETQHLLLHKKTFSCR